MGAGKFNNLAWRKKIDEAGGVRRIAEVLGVDSSTLSHALAESLSENYKKRITDAINQITTNEHKGHINHEQKKE